MTVHRIFSKWSILFLAAVAFGVCACGDDGDAGGGIVTAGDLVIVSFRSEGPPPSSARSW